MALEEMHLAIIGTGDLSCPLDPCYEQSRGKSYCGEHRAVDWCDTPLPWNFR